MQALGFGRFLGTGGVLRRGEGTLFYETRHEAAARLSVHVHEDTYLCLVLSGTMEEFGRGESRACSADTVLVNPAGVEHADRFGPAGARCFIAQVGPDWLSARGATAPLRWGALPDPAGGWLARCLREEVCRWDASSPLAVEGLLLQLLADAQRVAAAPGGLRPRWLDRVVERLRVEFAAPPLLTDLAREAEVSPVEVRRRFVRYEGCSPGEFARRCRAAFARSAIEAGTPLAAVATIAGYADQAHLTRDFRRRFGVTPSKFRPIRGGLDRSEPPGPVDTR